MPPNTLDPQLVNLAKAIRQTESQGNFTTHGKSGEYGAYQFMPSTWAEAAPKFGVNVPLEKATPDQQNEVAYKQLAEWKQQHPDWNVGNYASAWNAGPHAPDAYLNGNVGTNSQGVHYDTPAYAKNVATAYQQIKGQGGQTPPGYVDPNSQQQQPQQSGYGYVTPPTPQAPEIAGQPTQQEQQSTGIEGLVRGAGNILAGAESPFLGVAAIPTQLLAKGLGQPDPYANGIPGGVPGLNQKADVTPLDLEKKAGDVAQVGSYFVPGSEGLGAIGGAVGMGALQGAGSAMSAGDSLPQVAASGALGAGTGLALAGGTMALGAGVRAVGDTISGQAATHALTGIKDAYASALNLNAAERGFESRSGKDLAQVLVEHQAPLGRYENGTLDASGAIPKLQTALDPLNARADALVGSEAMNTKVANFIPLDSTLADLTTKIKNSSMDSLEKESSITSAEKLFDAIKREYGDTVSPQVAEKIKQTLQKSAFKKALTTSDALQKNVTYLASDVMKTNVEKAIGGTAGKEYRALNLQRADLIDAITRLTKLDGVRLLKGGRLGNMAGGVVGAISGAASGLGALGALAGDYFGTRAAEFMNSPATKIGAAQLKAKAAGLVPGLVGKSGRAIGGAVSKVGAGIGKAARAAGAAGNLIYSNSAGR